jgi:type I restriction enzyme, S subunit
MKSNYRRIGDFIQIVDERNAGLKVQKLLGLSISKQFIPSVANIIGTDMENYKIIRRNQFACSTMQVRRDKKMPVALLQEMDEAIISQAYPIFEVKDQNLILPEYLMMWFTRSEFDREACFHAVGGVRGSLEWEDFTDMQLPLPSLTKQREIVKEYNVVQNRIALNQQLIQKLEETAQAIYKRWFVEFEFPDENGLPYKSNGGEMEFNEELEKEIPRGWELMPLSKVASYINRGITPRYVENDGIIVINQKCVRDNSIDFAFSRRHNNKLKKIDNNRYLQHFDILVNSTGEGTLGRVGLVKEEHSQLIVDTHITIVRTSDILLPLCLWFSLSSKTDEIEKLAEGSTGQTELGRSNLGELQMLIPSDYTQKQFEKIAKSIIAYSSKTENELPALISLKDLLLSKLATIEN